MHVTQIMNFWRNEQAISILKFLTSLHNAK